MKKILIIISFIEISLLFILFICFYRYSNLIFVTHNDFEAICSLFLPMISVNTTIGAILLTYYLTNKSNKLISDKANKINTLESLRISNTMYGESKNKSKTEDEYKNQFENSIIALPFTYDEYDLYKWTNEKVKFLNLWNSVFEENKGMDYFFNNEKVKYLKYNDQYKFNTKNNLNQDMEQYQYISKIENFIVINKKLYIFTNQREQQFSGVGIYYNENIDQGSVNLVYDDYILKGIRRKRNSGGKCIPLDSIKRNTHMDIFRINDMIGIINKWKINGTKTLKNTDEIIFL